MRLTKGALISMGEAATSRALRKYFHKKPYVIHKDVSVRQVIDVDKSELEPGEWTYYTRAAFDFVVCKDDDTQPYELVIEYDGTQHENPTQARKDALKNRLCVQASLPILRIGVEDVKVRGNLSLLEYMLDLYFHQKSLNELQEKGLIEDAEDIYFISSGFPETKQIMTRLERKRIVSDYLFSRIENQHGPAIAEKCYWYRIIEKEATFFLDEPSKQLSWKAQVQVDIIKGWKLERPVITVEKQFTLKDCNPQYNVPGILMPELVIELARFMCFEEIERKVEKLLSPKR